MTVSPGRQQCLRRSGGSRRARAAGLVTAGLAVALVVLCGCAGSSPSPRAPVDVRIASFDFPESDLLAQLYGQALQARGLTVDILAGLGSREVVEPALQQHKVDLVPEYAGSALDFLAGHRLATADAATTYRRLSAMLAAVGVTALRYAPAVDQNGVVVLRSTADRLGLRTVSDLAAVAHTLVFVGPPECPSRPLCLAGLRATYGLHFAEFRPAAERADIAAALLAGEVGVGMVETTSGYLTDRRLVLLRDDRALQPAENVVPVVSAGVLQRLGRRLADTVDAVSARLHTADLVAMNSRVQQDGESPRAVAADWLRGVGLLAAAHPGSS